MSAAQPIQNYKYKNARMPSLSLYTAFSVLLAFSQLAHADAEGPSKVKGNAPEREKVQVFIDATGWPRSWHENNSVITQVGNDNQARVDQMRDINNFDYGNYANIYQNGNRNEANIIQSGGNNIGLIGQIGNGHQATIEQTGNSFEAQVSQYGDQSEINISQSGSGLRSISVSQRANSGALVTIRTY